MFWMNSALSGQFTFQFWAALDPRDSQDHEPAQNIIIITIHNRPAPTPD
jgi:hypothetical protein